MGINPSWQEDFFVTVQDSIHQVELLKQNDLCVVNLCPNTCINLIPLNNNFSPDRLIVIQNEHKKRGGQLVHLWEDVWLTKRAQVLSRMKSFLGQNETVHGRKTKITVLASQTAKQFLEENHLQGFVKCETYLGLTFENRLVAVAGFSGTRPMKSKGAGYKSVELIRFASLGGITIAGGLSKLIKHFLTTVKVNDLMTYADRDWSIGKGYDKIGFEQTEMTCPTHLYVKHQTLQRYFPHRLPKAIVNAFAQQNLLDFDNFLAHHDFSKIFNTGNIKYHLHV